jgi:hypothetical protein
MPPPVYRLGITLRTKVEVSARICLRRGYKKISLSPGQYIVTNTTRNEEYWHNQELSDGYTYRIKAVDSCNPLFGKRISVWQNDLNTAVMGIEED